VGGRGGRGGGGGGGGWEDLCTAELEFLKNLWVLRTEKEYGYRTGPPGYIGWRNSFLGVNAWAPQTFKNTGSGCFN
jgi:hypothetical protein